MRSSGQERVVESGRFFMQVSEGTRRGVLSRGVDELIGFRAAGYRDFEERILC